VARELQTVAVAAPTSLDWVVQGAVTPVKDQSNCGSCWAFSTTGAIEGAYQIASGKLVSLSEQNLVSCSFNGNAGCGGGEQTGAFCWTYHNKGLCKEADYPYISGAGQDGWTCQTNCTKAVTVTGYKAVPKGSESALLQALLLGPVAIGVDASETPFYMYKKGIIDSPKCGKKIDHAVLLVGYGAGSVSEETVGGTQYWKVKNSWNKSWGEAGYLRIAKGKDLCAIADGASYPTGTEDASKAAPSPPATKTCPMIPPPPPRLPESYSVNVTQTWGDPKYPGSGMFYVSNGALTLNIAGYMMLDETKLYRCDIDRNATIPGHEYYIHTNGKCDKDPTGADESMTCPWSRWADEIMSQLITAAPTDKNKPCPKNPYAAVDENAGAMCNSYTSGAGTDYITEFWLTTAGVPVKENQVLKGPKGFTVTTYYSDFKTAEPAASVFNIPSKCAKTTATEAPSEVQVLPPAEMERRRWMRAALREARAKRGF
jgi:hypothetical protein